jgi:protein-S-isoprenylcysteine O-methyltransferase Ste14
MFRGLAQSIVILILAVIFYSIDFFMIHRYDKQRKQQKSGRSWDYTLLMLVIAIVIILQPIFLPQLSLFTKQVWGLVIQVMGITLAACALALHIWARQHLQYFYAERVEILPNHQVIETGPYMFVRHPIIISFFGLAIGFFLINPALTTLAMMIYTFWDFEHAALQEEKLLSQNLPAYREYMQRTPRFLPRLWRGK